MKRTLTSLAIIVAALVTAILALAGNANAEGGNTVGVKPAHNANVYLWYNPVYTRGGVPTGHFKAQAFSYDPSTDSFIPCKRSICGSIALTKGRFHIVQPKDTKEQFVYGDYAYQSRNGEFTAQGYWNGKPLDNAVTVLRISHNAIESHREYVSSLYATLYNKNLPPCPYGTGMMK